MAAHQALLSLGISKLSDANMAYDACKSLKPDLVLMDVYTENGNNGIDAAKRIKKDFPDIKIIIMTGMPEVSYIKKAKEANVDSFIYKNTSGADLLSILSSTLNGYHIFPQEQTNQFGTFALTKRELEILQLICNGLDQKAKNDCAGYCTDFYSSEAYNHAAYTCDEDD